jgi:hypothetical protein
MYAVGTEVVYHGSIEELHGETFTIRGHHYGRYHLHGVCTLRTFRLDRVHALRRAPGTFQLDRSADTIERAALARIRAEIARVPATGYDNEMRWFPGCPVL